MKKNPRIIPVIGKPNNKKFLRGKFEVKNGKLYFTTSINNVSFDEMLQAITMLGDECQRQIDNKNNCTFHPKKDINWFDNYTKDYHEAISKPLYFDEKIPLSRETHLPCVITGKRCDCKENEKCNVLINN